MTKAILYDADGVVFLGESFSERYAREFSISKEIIGKLFQGDFQLCASGKAELTDIIKKYLADWHWDGTTDTLIEYWLQDEYLNRALVDKIASQRANGIKCYLVGNQERIRARYLDNKYDLQDIFDDIYFSVDMGYLKPSEDYLVSVFNRVNAGIPDIAKEDIVFIDDEQKNVDAALEFGFHAEIYHLNNSG